MGVEKRREPRNSSPRYIPLLKPWATPALWPRHPSRRRRERQGDLLLLLPDVRRRLNQAGIDHAPDSDQPAAWHWCRQRSIAQSLQQWFSNTGANQRLTRSSLRRPRISRLALNEEERKDLSHCGGGQRSGCYLVQTFVLTGTLAHTSPVLRPKSINRGLQEARSVAPSAKRHPSCSLEKKPAANWRRPTNWASM